MLMRYWEGGMPGIGVGQVCSPPLPAQIFTVPTSSVFQFPPASICRSRSWWEVFKPHASVFIRVEFNAMSRENGAFKGLMKDGLKKVGKILFFPTGTTPRHPLKKES